MDEQWHFMYLYWCGYWPMPLSHWGQVTHICVGKLTIIGSDNGLSPERRQAIIWTNDGILLIELLGTNFNEILIEIQTFSLKKIRLKMWSAKWRPLCLGLNVLNFITHKYVYNSQTYIVRESIGQRFHLPRWGNAVCHHKGMPTI